QNKTSRLSTTFLTFSLIAGKSLAKELLRNGCRRSTPKSPRIAAAARHRPPHRPRSRRLAGPLAVLRLTPSAHPSMRPRRGPLGPVYLSGWPAHLVMAEQSENEGHLKGVVSFQILNQDENPPRCASAPG